MYLTAIYRTTIYNISDLDIVVKGYLQKKEECGIASFLKCDISAPYGAFRSAQVLEEDELTVVVGVGKYGLSV